MCEHCLEINSIDQDEEIILETSMEILTLDICCY